MRGEAVKRKTKNIGVRLDDQELLVLASVPAENYPSAVRYLIKYWSEREQQAEQLQQVGDRIIASLAMKIEAMGQDNKAIDMTPLLAAFGEIKQAMPKNSNSADLVVRKGLAETIRHGLIPLAQMDRRGPLLAAAEMLEKAK